MKNQFHSRTAPFRSANVLAALRAHSATLWTALGRAARLLPLLLLLTLPAVVQAQFSYTTDSGTITITGYTGSGGAVTIPSTINDLPVTRIGDSAFQERTGLTSVTIPNSVTSIGVNAFLYCTGLTNVTIPNSVTSIGSYAFESCTGLTSVTIPNSVTSIERGAFSGCTSLTSVTIPNSVTYIGEWTFAFCTSLTNVTIGNSVTSIGAYAFAGCTSLTAITVDALNSAYSSVDGVLFNKNQSTLIQYPGGKAGSYSIPNSVTSIGGSSFRQQGAFFSCTSLTSVTIPNSVTLIGGGAFASCTSLTNVTIPNSVTSIGDSAFSSCTSLTNITIPNSVTGIGDSAFSSCTSLTSVTIPNSVTTIGHQVFQGCTSLTNVTIGNSVTTIGQEAFYGCTSLTAITMDALNSAYSSVDGVLFDKSQTMLIQYPGGKAGSDYTIPNSVTSIGNGAFNNCTDLSSVTIPNSVTNIGFYAFSGCTSLTNVTIGNSVTSIGSEAFYHCSSLTSVTIPNSVTSIGGGYPRFGISGAFSGCTSLTNVTIGNSVTNIGDVAFSGCTNLTGVYFKGNAPSVVGFYVFDGADKATVYYLPGTTGWGATFAGRPTAQWLPEARTTDADFGVRTNQFGFNIRWASDKVVVVEASPDLSNLVWTPVSTNTLASGSSYFSDPQWTNHPTRFYRLVSPVP